jgi:hypothetical protein
MNNRFPGKCCVCGNTVPAGDGSFVKGHGLKHLTCLYGRGRNLAENTDRKIQKTDNNAFGAAKENHQ